MRALARLVLRASAGVMALNGAAGAALCAGPGGAASGARPCVDAVHDVATTRWLKLQTLDYTDEAGKARKWDMASRTTKRAGTSDGVAILALLRSTGSSAVETLLVERTPRPRQRRREMDWIHREADTRAPPRHPQSSGHRSAGGRSSCRPGWSTRARPPRPPRCASSRRRQDTRAYLARSPQRCRPLTLGPSKLARA